MDIFFELFYTLYPFLFKIAVLPVWLMFLVLEATNRVLEFLNFSFGEHFSMFLVELTYSIFLTSGVIFIEQTVLLLLRVRKQIDWFRVGLLHLLVLFMFFSSVMNSSFGYVENIWPLVGSIGIVGIAYLFILILKKTISWGLEIGKLSKKIPKKVVLIVKILLPIVYLYPFFVGIMFLVWFGYPDNPQASRFNIINAAIKNTCFIDPNKENCPQDLEEISYIEPKQYQMMVECCQVNYQYDSVNNLYSLVIRYSPTRAVLFDWRLVDQSGIDFKEYQVNLLGKDSLIDAPDWDGPWEFEDWDY